MFPPKVPYRTLSSLTRIVTAIFLCSFAVKAFLKNGSSRTDNAPDYIKALVGVMLTRIDSGLAAGNVNLMIHGIHLFLILKKKPLLPPQVTMTPQCLISSSLLEETGSGAHSTSTEMSIKGSSFAAMGLNR